MIGAAPQSLTPVFSADDHRFMSRAVALARHGLNSTAPNPRVGCVIVRGGVIVGEGFHLRAGEPHAEVHALRMAGDLARGATAYVTLEPCSHFGRTPPCADALLQAGVARVVAAMTDPNPLVSGQGLARLLEGGVSVASGLLESEARALNLGFIKRMATGLPWLRLKMAMSLDGRTAMASGESVWITGDAARRDVQSLRARSCAVLSGVGSILFDDPSLNVRLGDDNRQPVRVILDTFLRTPLTAKTLALPGEVFILHACDDPQRIQALESLGAVLLRCDAAAGRLDLPGVMALLGQRGLNEIHVEAGATLAGAILSQGLVDELVVYLAPCLMGSSARPLFGLPDIKSMSQRHQLRVSDIRAVGDDWRITATCVETIGVD